MSEASMEKNQTGSRSGGDGGTGVGGLSASTHSSPPRRRGEAGEGVRGGARGPPRSSPSTSFP